MTGRAFAALGLLAVFSAGARWHYLHRTRRLLRDISAGTAATYRLIADRGRLTVEPAAFDRDPEPEPLMPWARVAWWIVEAAAAFLALVVIVKVLGL